MDPNLDEIQNDANKEFPASAVGSITQQCPLQKAPGAIEASQAAEKSATAEANARIEEGTFTKNKTVAADGTKTVSGWNPNPPDGYTPVPPEDVAAYSDKIGHDLKPSGAFDQVNQGGFPGKFNASHAEKQMTIASPGDPIGVSKPMCPDCVNFFKSNAQYTGNPQTVTDPEMTRIFNPNGTVTEIPK